MRLPHLTLLLCMICSATPLSCCGRPPPAFLVRTDAGTTYKVLSEGTIFLEGKPGLWIKYEASVIDEPKNLSDAKELFEVYQNHAESRGLRLAAITAVVPDKRAGPFYVNQTYNAVFERGPGGLWTATLPRTGDAGAPPVSSGATNDGGAGTPD